MDVKLFLISILFIVVGIIIMVWHKFYKYKTDDMLFAIELRIFMGGLLFTLAGCYGLVSELLKFFKQN